MPNSNVIDCSTSAEQLSTATAVRDFMYMKWDVSTDPQIKDDIVCMYVCIFIQIQVHIKSIYIFINIKV